jgi:hypothetical protein
MMKFGRTDYGILGDAVLTAKRVIFGLVMLVKMHMKKFLSSLHQVVVVKIMGGGVMKEITHTALVVVILRAR